MNEFEAAMGVCNLRHLDEQIQKRKIVAERYTELLSGRPGIRFPDHPADVRQNYAYFPVFFDPETFDGAQILPWIIEGAREGRRLGRTDLGIGAAYAGYLAGNKGRRSFGLFFHELAANREGAVLWHCHTGKDRTGIAAGLILDVLGADWDTILKDYETSNLFYRSDVEKMEQRLRRMGVEEEILAPLCGFVGVHRDMLENAWKYMDREWGGAVGYLTSCCGVSMDEIETLRERYIEA